MLFVLLYAMSLKASSADYLFRNGQTDYSIVLAADASTSERTAAKELQAYLFQIGRVTLPVVQKSGGVGKHIYVGWHKAVGCGRPAGSDDSFCYKKVGADLFIYGGSERGTMYGVYTFLERELGVHWYTSAYTHVPRLKQFALGEINHSESPAFGVRLDFYYDAMHHHDWAARNLLNSQYSSSDGNYGRVVAYWGIHTFHTLVPPAIYFKHHPEYFSVRNGRRTDKGQLCLSNAKMRKVLISNLKQTIADNPGYWCYDVSQNDNQYPCECTSCRQLVERYGGQSGAMLWFVNKVAEEIKKDFPDKYIGTFAYRYTRQAPNSSIKPADNVVIRLCDIECCMGHALTACEQNRSFVSDLEAWKKRTDKIYIWNYTTCFHHYLLPFPNVAALVQNYRYFQSSNVVGILEEGAHDAPWSEFSELKQWLVAKLLWNPHQDADSLARLFIRDYYGKSAPYIQQYYELCQSQVTPTTHFGVYANWSSDLYSSLFLASGQKLVDKALAMSGDAETQRRVKRIGAQLHYLKLRQNTMRSAADGTLRQFKDIIKNDSTIIREFGYTLDKLLNDLSYY